MLPTRQFALRDCTASFKDRVASFEYGYYPGYWLYPYWPDLLSTGGAMIGYSNGVSVKKDKTYQWILHNCRHVVNHAAVCLESKRNGWDGYFFGEAKNSWNLYLDNNLSNGIDKLVPMKIFCDSCSPGGPDNFTYSNCELRTSGGKKIYSSQKGRIYDCPSCGKKNWFQWRIESPPTRQYWATIYEHCNNGTVSSTEASISVKTSIGTIDSETSASKISASHSVQISAGMEAAKLIKSLTGERSDTYSRTHMKLYVDEKEVQLRKTIPSGKKWIVQQLVGQAGYTTINTSKHREHMVPC